MNEQAVIVHFEYAADSLAPLFELEERLEAAITAAGVGEFDGNEIAVDGSAGSLYMYGPDADALYSVVRPLLNASVCLRNAQARLRYGPPQQGVRERLVAIAAPEAERN